MGDATLATLAWYNHRCLLLLVNYHAPAQAEPESCSLFGLVLGTGVSGLKKRGHGTGVLANHAFLDSQVCMARR
jgi:hypothetical protein